MIVNSGALMVCAAAAKGQSAPHIAESGRSDGAVFVGLALRSSCRTLNPL